MTRPAQPTPDRVMQFITGGWATAILGAAAKHGIFNALERDGDNAKGVATKTGISERGAQALLDGLTGLGLVSLSNGRYRNTPDAEAFLIKGKPAYLGGFADVMAGSMADWATLSEAAKTGKPTAGFHAEMADNEFWHVLVPAIAPLSVPAAQLAGERLGIAKAGAIRWLDVGGGSGIWSALWLGANKQAKGVQLDWPIVNKIAKGFVGNFGVADRFETIDGDFHVVDFGSGQYDYAIYGNIAHQEAPAANIEVFRKFRKALKPGGTLIINDFILTDERKGHPVALMFAAQMLLATQGGNAWREADYRTWLAEAGFKSVELVPTDGPATVVLAK